jgi:hypothetical protein
MINSRRRNRRSVSEAGAARAKKASSDRCCWSRRISMALTYVLKDEIAVGVGSPTIRPEIINDINSPHMEENL